MTKDHFPPIGRRQVLIGAGGFALACVTPGAGRATPGLFVTSESGTLRTVLVHPATWADFANCGLLAGTNPFWLEAVQALVAGHAAMARRVEATGARVLYFQDILQSAIEEAKRRGVWVSWLGRVFPHYAERKGVDAATLLRRDHGEYDAAAMHDLFYLRDFAVMLPHGLALSGDSDPGRKTQADLFRFTITFASEMRHFPVVFDGVAERLRVEGRDILVLDPQTLLLGVGNWTDARSGPALASRTGLDVIAVNLDNTDRLDMVVSQVTPDHLIALSEPLPIIRYRATTGDLDASVSGMKLSEYLLTRGIHVSHGGGWNRTLVLATMPASVLAFDDGEDNHAFLLSCGVQVGRIACDGTNGQSSVHALALALERT